ncbi:MAG: glycosyltransferase [Sulfuricella sp.]|nr:glycosyltransferase [Sulfuricella sp.]
MSSEPLVSVIMNCLNCERYLHEAIDSVYAQTYSNWEIVFYDNASSDSSAGIAQCHDSRLRYVRGDATIPLGAARNEAISRAQGDLVAFLDCDDRWLPDKLERQVALFAKHPDVDFAYGNFFFTRPGNDRMHLGFRRKQPQGHVFGKFLIYFPVNLQTVMIRKSVLDKLPELFDANLNLAEDYDLFLRLLYTARAAYMDQPLAVYRMHSGMSSIRYAEKYPDELVYCIEKLKVLYPELEQDYRKELAYLDAKIAYWRAKSAILQGRSSVARTLLKPHKKKGLTFLGLYYAAYLPSGLWVKLQELRLFLR